MKIAVITVVCVLLFCLQFVNPLVVESPESLRGKFLLSPSIHFDREFSFINTEVVAAVPFEACSSLRNVDQARGKLVLVTDKISGIGCSYRTKIRIVQEAEAAGIILIRAQHDGGLGGVAFYNKGVDFSGITINGVEIKEDQGFIDAVKSDDIVVVTIERPDENKVKVLVDSHALTVFTVLFELYGLVSLVIAIIKLRGFVKAFGWQLSPPQICLSLEIFAVIERMIYIVDPFWSRGIYPVELGWVLITLSFPLTYTTTLFVAFYWEASMRSMSTKSAFGKTKWVFVVCSILLATMSFVRSALAASYVNVTLFSLLYVIIVLPIIPLFFIICGARIISVLRSNSSLSVRQRSPLIRISIYVIASAVFLILLIIGLILYSSSLHSEPWRMYVIWWIIYFSVFSITFCHIMAFQSPLMEKDALNSSQRSPSTQTTKESRDEEDGRSVNMYNVTHK